MRWHRVTLLLFCIGASCVGDAPPWNQIGSELVEMGQQDQAVRQEVTVASLADTLRLRRMLAVDSANTERLREIVQAHGWPGISDVGEEGAQAAWLILQHSADFGFQRRMLPVLQAAAERGEVSRQELALLTDRVLVGQGEPQRYGTQFKLVDGQLVFERIEAPETVDERRASVGLPPLEEYRRMAEEFYRVEPAASQGARRDSS